MDVKTWLIEWFKTNTDLSEGDIGNNLNANYFEKGWIDSFKFINFITDVEENFDIRFSNDQFQDRTFSTIDGVIRLIEEKINEKI